MRSSLDRLHVVLAVISCSVTKRTSAMQGDDGSRCAAFQDDQSDSYDPWKRPFVHDLENILTADDFAVVRDAIAYEGGNISDCTTKSLRKATSEDATTFQRQIPLPIRVGMVVVNNLGDIQRGKLKICRRQRLKRSHPREENCTKRGALTHTQSGKPSHFKAMGREHARISSEPQAVNVFPKTDNNQRLLKRGKTQTERPLKALRTPYLNNQHPSLLSKERDHNVIRLLRLSRNPPPPSPESKHHNQNKPSHRRLRSLRRHIARSRGIDRYYRRLLLKLKASLRDCCGCDSDLLLVCARSLCSTNSESRRSNAKLYGRNANGYDDTAYSNNIKTMKHNERKGSATYDKGYATAGVDTKYKDTYAGYDSKFTNKRNQGYATTRFESDYNYADNRLDNKNRDTNLHKSDKFGYGHDEYGDYGSYYKEPAPKHYIIGLWNSGVYRQLVRKAAFAPTASLVTDQLFSVAQADGSCAETFAEVIAHVALILRQTSSIDPSRYAERLNAAYERYQDDGEARYGEYYQQPTPVLENKAEIPTWAIVTFFISIILTVIFFLIGTIINRQSLVGSEQRHKSNRMDDPGFGSEQDLGSHSSGGPKGRGRPPTKFRAGFVGALFTARSKRLQETSAARFTPSNRGIGGAAKPRRGMGAGSMFRYKTPGGGASASMGRRGTHLM